MKKLIAPILALMLIASVALAQVSFTITVDLTDQQARGLLLAVSKANAARKVADPNAVDLTPRQYTIQLLQDWQASWNNQADEESLTTDQVRELYKNATPAKRAAAIAALQ